MDCSRQITVHAIAIMHCLLRACSARVQLHFAFYTLTCQARLWTVYSAASFLLCFVPGAIYSAENPAPASASRIVDRDAFDQLILKRGDGQSTLEVWPLELPRRPLAAVPSEGAIRVRLVDRPGEEFEVSWSEVASVRVYEELLLAEAQRLTATGKFDEAYDYFARLSTEYASLPGLKNAVSDYLRRNALALYQAGEHDRALALLVTLHERNPEYAGLANAVQVVAGEIIQRYLREGNYSSARGVLELWQRQFPGLAADSAAEWRQRFEAAATRQLDEAKRLVDEKQYVAARKAVQRAEGIWPGLAAAADLTQRIYHEFPFVAVGVLENAPRQPSRRIDNWALLRTRRLVQRLLVEQSDFGADGGIYDSPFGDISLDDSGRELSLTLESSGAVSTRETDHLPPDAVSRFLLSLTQPDAVLYRSDFADLLGSVSLTGSRVQLHFTRAHVRPEALLQLPPPPPTTGSRQPAPGVRFSIVDHAASQVVFAAAEAIEASESAPRAVVEQRMADDEAAVKALISGDVDMLDRVPPWQVERLRGKQDLRVGSYRLPTVHVLLLNFDRPLLTRREFRRALCFGIDRKWIVDRVLTGGVALPGYEVLSGPFPSGVSLSDPIRYAYNGQIAPRPYEPRLAAILASIAWAGVQDPAGKGEQPLTALPELVLAHPNDPVIRVACQAIEGFLERAGIPIKLREFSAEELRNDDVDCDLRYAELAVWEPVTDARIVLGPEGVAGNVHSPYLDAALTKLDEATNWNDVRVRLSEVHETVHHELPLIPLWQTVNYFAYRTSIRGVGESPMVLYQNIEHWQLGNTRNVARLDRGN
jgi:tetratricopeptide (TPR) repeat protein